MIHTYESLGIKIAVDVNSGAVHVLDDISYDLLNKYKDAERLPENVDLNVVSDLNCYLESELNAAFAELKILEKEGLLFAADDYIDPKAASVFQKLAVVKALCLHVSHDCNLRCKYCFASTGDFGTGRKTMPAETAKKAIDWVIARSGHRRNIEVDFFGGEPLMAMDTVKETVEYARSVEKAADKNFRFTITTNGVLLSDDNIEYINEKMDNCVLSLDGRKEVNDNMRPTINNSGSYDVIMPKFKKLVSGREGKDWYIRGTFTRDNLDFSNDVIHIANEGFTSISVEPCSGDTEDPFAIKEEDLPTVFAEYEKLAEYLLKDENTNFFHFNVDLEQGPCVVKRIRGCGAGCEYVAITPDGDIYPCHQFVGKEEFKMGNVYTGEFNTSISEKFAEENVYTKAECKKCWAKFYCSGGCSASNYIVNNDIQKPNHVACEMEKKRLECAIAMKAVRANM